MNIKPAAQDAGTALVNIQGRLDAAAALNFKQQITTAISEGNVRLALHLAHVSFMDSTGLGALVAALKAARKANGDINIVAPSSQVQKLFRLTAMDRVFRIFETHDEALRQLKPDSRRCLEHRSQKWTHFGIPFDAPLLEERIGSTFH